MRIKQKLFILGKTMRVHQYVKNILIFIPFFTNLDYWNMATISTSLYAFLSF